MIASLILAAAQIAGFAHVPLETRQQGVMAFAACIRDRDPAAVKLLLSREPRAEGQAEIFRKLAKKGSGCIGTKSSLSFPCELLYGQLVELAYRDDPSMLVRAAKITSERADSPDMSRIEAAVDTGSAEDRPREKAQVFRAAFARCVAARSPADVFRLLPTKSASDEEFAVLISMKPSLDACTPTGVQYRADPEELRFYLLAALYTAALPRDGR